MRIWDVPPDELCRSHLLGEHRELHGLWNILTRGLRGYRTHPETRRWEGKLAALYGRHQALVAAMERRGYRHASPLDPTLATGSRLQDTLLEPLDVQRELLESKPCDCPLTGPRMANVSRCTHQDQIREVEPRTPAGCEECLETGDRWVHLRLCLTCGHVGCCDSSPNRHATRHHHATMHPMVQSFEPNEDWRWCYVDRVFLRS